MNSARVEDALHGRLDLLPRGSLGRRLAEHLQRLLPAQFLAWDRHRVLARQASQADVIARMLQRGDQAPEGQIPEAVRVDEVRNLGDRLLVRDELVPRLHVDPEVAREANRQTPDSHVDLAGSRKPQDPDDLPDRRAADDLIFDLYAALVLDLCAT